MLNRLRVVVVASALVLANTVSAQGRVVVRGIAFDSLRGAPLANAFIAIVGASRTTTSDARGRFQFDSVAPGVYTFTAQHALIDSIGFSGISARAKVSDGRDEVRIAVPSIATLWRATCGDVPRPTSRGLVYGTVRDGAARPVLNARVDVTWLDLNVNKSLDLRQRRWRGQAISDSSGSYAVCGVPSDVGVRIQASSDSAASGLIDLFASGLLVQRRDLTVGPRIAGDTKRGIIAGRVVDAAGGPVDGARVISDDVPEARSAPDGRFFLRDVPIGTRQVEVLAIGMMPIVTTVDVSAADTAAVIAHLRKITNLDVVRVTAPGKRLVMVEQIEERRRRGLGYHVDSAAIAARGALSSVFHEFPSVALEYPRGSAASRYAIMLPNSTGRCVANLFIDGTEQRGASGDPASAFDELNVMHPTEIAAIEIYPHGMSTPVEFMGRDPAASRCGSVVVWTKHAVAR